MANCCSAAVNHLNAISTSTMPCPNQQQVSFGSEQLLNLAEARSLDDIAKQGITFTQGDVNFKLDGMELCYAIVTGLQARAAATGQHISFVVRMFCVARTNSLPRGAFGGECERVLRNMLTELAAAQNSTQPCQTQQPSFGSEQLLSLAEAHSLDDLAKRGITFNQGGVNFKLDGKELCYAVVCGLQARIAARKQPMVVVFGTFYAARNENLPHEARQGECEKMFRGMVTELLQQTLPPKPDTSTPLMSSADAQALIAAASVLVGMANAPQQQQQQKEGSCGDSNIPRDQEALAAASVLFEAANVSQPEWMMQHIARFRAW